MTFVQVEEIPKATRQKHLSVFFDEFMSANVKFAEVKLDKGDYKDAKVACNCLYIAAKRGAYPISVHLSNGKVYFERRDI